MAKTTQRASNFPQIGGEGEQYHKSDRSGEPKFTASGSPEMTWRFPYTGSFREGSPEHIAATANFLHSIRNAPEETVRRGMEWYPKVNDAVSKGVSKRGFLGSQADKHLAGSGLVAALSPNMDWDASNIHALGEISKLKSSHWDTIMHGSDDDARGAVEGLSIAKSPLGNLRKAGRIIRGEDPESVLSMASAPKTHSFMQNIHDPSNDNFTTIDGRAFDTMTNRMRPWDIGRGIGGSTKAKSPPGRYVGAANVVSGVARALEIHPSEAQAISWEHTKYNIEQAGGSRSQGPMRVGQPYFDPKTGASAAHLPHLGGQFHL